MEPGSPLSWLAVFVGGGLGSCLRWSASLLIGPQKFPWATLGVNALGSFLMGLVLSWVLSVEPNPGWRLFLAVGCLGGFTTFSAFSFDALGLLQGRSYLAFAWYVTGSVASGLVLCWIGWAVGQKLWPAP